MKITLQMSSIRVVMDEREEIVGPPEARRQQLIAAVGMSSTTTITEAAVRPRSVVEVTVGNANATVEADDLDRDRVMRVVDAMEGLASAIAEKFPNLFR